MIETKDGVATFKGLEGIFGNVITVAIGFAGVVFLVMLIIGGLNLLTAGSEAPKAETAKKTITFAIYGFIFVALAYLILTLIKSFTGVDVTQFKVTQ
jgi:Type IV secretion system pilin